MIDELIFDAFVAAGMVMFALLLRSVERILRLHDERLRLNTRRHSRAKAIAAGRAWEASHG